MVGPHDELAAIWRWFVAEEAARYSPLYTAIVGAAAADEDILALVASAPPASHYPLLVLAAVHDMVLAGELPELAAVYRGEGPLDAAPPLFRAAVLDHREHVLGVLHDRFVQTNECGRASPLALGLAAVAAAVGEPDALIDAGASAGLNLLYDRYRLDMGDVGVWGDPASPVVCSCDVRGTPPPWLRYVDVPVRVGLDRAPVDITDPRAARWLLACNDAARFEPALRACFDAGELVTARGPVIPSGSLRVPRRISRTGAAQRRRLQGSQPTSFDLPWSEVVDVKTQSLGRSRWSGGFLHIEQRHGDAMELKVRRIRDVEEAIHRHARRSA